MTSRVATLLAALALAGCDASSSSPTGTSAGAEIADAEKARVARFWTLYREAQEQLANGNVDQAIASYRQVLAIRPDHEDSNYNLGNLLARKGEFALALASFEALFRANPLSPRGHYQAAELLSSCEPGAPVDFACARRHIEAGLAINPEESGPYYERGHLALLCGDWQHAASDLELAVRRNPRGFAASSDLACLARLQGDTERAASLYLRAIEQCRGDLPIAGVLGEGDTEATKQRFHPEAERSIAILAGLVRSSLAQGRYAENVPEPLRLTTAFTVAPATSGAWFAPPIETSRAGGGAVAVDLDHDGDLDLVLAGWQDAASVLVNDAGRWVEEKLVVVAAAAPRCWDVVRLSRDDEPTLLYFVQGGWGTSANRLLRARDDGAFDDITAASGLDPTHLTLSACVLDVNGDREPDLIEGLATGHEALHVSLRHGDHFAPANTLQVGGPITSLREHERDVLVARGSAPLVLAHVDPDGTWHDQTKSRGLAGASGWVAAWVDIDGDGRADVFAPGMPTYEQALTNWLALPAAPPRVVFHRAQDDGSFAPATDLTLRLGTVLDVAVLEDVCGPALYLACGGLRLDHEEMDVVLRRSKDGSLTLNAPWAAEHLPGKTVHVLAARFDGDGLVDLYLARSGFYPGDRRGDRILRGLPRGETAQR